MKKKPDLRFPSERPLKEQIHYFTCVVEDIRSQNRVVMDYMKMGFAKIYEDMAAMEERLNIKIDANTYAIKELQREVAWLKEETALLKEETAFLKGETALLKKEMRDVRHDLGAIWKKEQEQDREIALFKAHIN